MRVLMIGWFADAQNSGGMEVHIREVCRNLSLAGHSVELVMPGAAQKPMDETGAKIRYVSCKIACNSLDGVIKSVRNFNKKIIAGFKNSKAGFDVIHSHDWLGVEAAEFLKEKSGKPWIHTVHSLEHIRAAEDIKEAESRISDIEKLGIAECDRIITVSSLMKAEILRKYNVLSGKISVIYNYAGFGSAPIPGKRQLSPVIFFAGRLALQKGIGHLILAFEKALKEIPSAKLVIAGGGNLESSLKSMASSSGIEGSVRFEGFASETRLKELYTTADLFVSPSVLEPFGITVLDAVKFSVPVIATKNTGCLELFSDGSIAVAEPENSSDITEKIIRLLKNKNERSKMAESAKKDLENADGWRRIAKKTAQVYASFQKN